ncbi:MAG: hypothetical protein IJT96_07835 [Lachnospiraceae bacterium]|nr:hypothetical protein [Lachnospiraceae bacterium]
MESKQFYKYVFCILVYKNTEDIEECISSIRKNVSEYKVVMVNSFYDQITEKKFSDIAQVNDADFISVENKGYGYGNNAGIDYIRQKYCFDYVIISNPDVIIKEFVDLSFDTNVPIAVSPRITTIRHKNQNPYWIVKNPPAEWMIYFGMKKKIVLLCYFGYAVNKILRETGLFFMRLTGRNEMKVYAGHGSFILFSRALIYNYEKLYDEKMFLFSEEAYLAHRFEKDHVNTIMVDSIKVEHKEDGSIKISNIDENSIQRDSVIYYYENKRAKY